MQFLVNASIYFLDLNTVQRAKPTFSKFAFRQGTQFTTSRKTVQRERACVRASVRVCV